VVEVPVPNVLGNRLLADVASPGPADSTRHLVAAFDLLKNHATATAQYVGLPRRVLLLLLPRRNILIFPTRVPLVRGLVAVGARGLAVAGWAHENLAVIGLEGHG
jgi:hypothetical protein